jgi:hypothetical protein
MINFFVIFAFIASVLEFELSGADAYDYGFRGWEVHGSAPPLAAEWPVKSKMKLMNIERRTFDVRRSIC